MYELQTLTLASTHGLEPSAYFAQSMICNPVDTKAFPTCGKATCHISPLSRLQETCQGQMLHGRKLLKASNTERFSVVCRYFDGLLRRGALAHIVAGFVQRRPFLIEQGSALLRGHSNVSTTALHSSGIVGGAVTAC